jgi:hypothetical protein
MKSDIFLRIPLYEAFQKDTQVKKVFRPVDSSWKYEGLIPCSPAGFNPFESSVYFGKHSLYSSYLKSPTRARELNPDSALVREVLFSIHDYLHCWSLNLFHDCFADRHGWRGGRITREKLEEQAFLLILSEAVATVGLDYWYLSNTDLDRTLGIGSSLKNLTTTYRTEDDYEYRVFRPDFDSQTPEFFRELSEFYLSGVFQGFSISDLKRSHKLLKWLRHELNYADFQRRYTREWLAYWGGIHLPADTLSSPISYREGWKKELIAHAGKTLFHLVKENKPVFFKAAPGPDSMPSGRKPDFRFLNFRKHGAPLKALDSDTFLRSQLISFFRYDSSVPERLKHRKISELTTQELKKLIRELDPISGSIDQEPDMIFLIP